MQHSFNYHYQIVMKKLNLFTLLLTMALAANAEQDSTATDNQKQDSSEDVEVLNEVIVIGQKINRSLQETVAGTSVLDDDFIEDTEAVNFAEVLDYASNVSLIETGNYNSFSIRGINIKGLDGGGTELGSIFLNDAFIPVPVFHGNLALWDIDQVVINKGPQSTTQGKNSLAGTVHLQNHRPIFGTEAAVQFGVGNYGRQQAALMFNSQLGDNFAVRISAQHNENDGQITNIYLNDKQHDFSKNTSANLQFLYEPSEATSALLTLGSIDDSRGVRLTCNETNSTADYPCQRGQMRANQSIKPHHNINTNYQVLNISHQFNSNWSFKSITGRTDVEDDDYEDWTRYNVEAPNYPQAAGQRFEANENYNGWERESLNQEFRLNFENSRVRSSSGIYWARNTTYRYRDGLVPYDFSSFLSALDASGALALAAGEEYLRLRVSEDGGTYETNNIAIFNDTDFDLTDRLTLNIGLRYDREKTSVISKILTARADDLATLDQALPNSVQYTAAGTSLANVACALNPQLCGASFTQILSALNQQQLPGLNAIADGYIASTINNGYNQPVEKTTRTFLPKLGIRYDVTDHIAVGYLFSRGYRSGGAGVNVGTGQAFEYEPEFLNNHEASLKTQWLGGRLTANVSAYYSKWKDQQINLIGNANPYDQETANAGKSELYGVELDVSYIGNSGLYGFANMALTRTEFKQFVNNGVDYSGNEFPDTPRASAAFGLGYRTEMGWNTNFTTRVLEGSYQQANNARKSPGYSMTDFRLGYDGGDWQITAFVNNVFDRKVENRYWVFNQLSFASASMYLPLRNYGLNFRYDF